MKPTFSDPALLLEYGRSLAAPFRGELSRLGLSERGRV